MTKQYVDLETALTIIGTAKRYAKVKQCEPGDMFDWAGRQLAKQAQDYDQGIQQRDSEPKS